MIYVYTCPYNNWVARENVGTCYTGTATTRGISKSLEQFTLVDDDNEGYWRFLTQQLFQNRDI